MSGSLGSLFGEATAFDAAVKALPEPTLRGERRRPGRTPKVEPHQDPLPLPLIETPPPARIRKPRAPRPALRRQLPPSDLGGENEHRAPDPVLLAALTKDLGPIATRRSPVRDMILAFLPGPRRAADIAAHIQRTVPITTGHLAAMQRLGLVKRIGRATYALATYTGEGAELGARKSGSAVVLRQKLRMLLTERRSLADLCAETHEPSETIAIALRDLWFSGIVMGDRINGYKLVSAVRTE